MVVVFSLPLLLLRLVIVQTKTPLVNATGCLLHQLISEDEACNIFVCAQGLDCSGSVDVVSFQSCLSSLRFISSIRLERRGGISRAVPAESTSLFPWYVRALVTTTEAATVQHHVGLPLLYHYAFYLEIHPPILDSLLVLL